MAVTPGKARGLGGDEVKRVCQTCTLAGLQAMWDAKAARPFRFVYLSAEGTPEDLTQKPLFFGDYRLMRVSVAAPGGCVFRLTALPGRDGDDGAQVRSGT